MWNFLENLINKIRHIGICEECGCKKSCVVEEGRWTRTYLCKCDAYKMVCKRPMKTQDYVDEWGVHKVRTLYAKDIYPESELRMQAEQFYKNNHSI